MKRCENEKIFGLGADVAQSEKENMTEKKIPIRKLRIICFAAAISIVPAVVLFFVLGTNRAWDSFATRGLIVLVITCMVILIVVYILMQLHKVSVSKMFFVALMLFGIVYLFVLPPNSSPDEPTHYMNSNQIANTVLGIGQPSESTFLYREGDKSFWNYAGYPDESTYRLFIDRLKAPTMDIAETGLIEENLEQSPDIFYKYIPQTISVLSGRIFGLSLTYTYMIGRLLNLILYALIVMLAIKIAPFGKSVFAVISLFPMTLELVASLSYDAVILELAFLAIALYLRLISNESTAKIRELILFCMVLFLLAPLKGVYITMFLLALFLPAKSFANRKSRLIFLLCFSFCLLVFAILFLHQYLSSFSTGYHAGRQGVTVFGLSDFLSNPVQFIVYALRTTWHLGYGYFLLMIGSGLGWLDIPVNIGLLFVYFLLAMIAALRTKGEPVVIRAKNKILFLLICAGTYLLTLFVFYISWTSVESRLIEGVQGRYFLPVLPLLLLTVLHFGKVSRKYITDKHLVMAACVLQSATLPFIFEYIINR